MQRYIVVRLFYSVIALVAISIIVFALARISGDPLDVLLPLEAGPEDYARVQKLWGLDRPLHEQYLVFVKNALQGGFGDSLNWPGNTATEMVLKRTPATLKLAGLAVLISTIISLPIGVIVAVKKDTGIDYAGKVIALLGQSLPSFWLGLMLMWIFAVTWKLLPTSGEGGISHMILPAITLGYFQVAALMRLIRSSMLEVLDSEFVKLARIKGISERRVIWKHCLRNAAIAPVTYFGIIFGILLTGSVVTETVFAWPGVGLLVIDAVRARDFQVVQAVVMIFAGLFILTNLLVDILYAYLDPRIRYT